MSSLIASPSSHMGFAKSTRPKIGILDYGMGNLRSVLRAFLAVGADAQIVTAPSDLRHMQALVFPGQGAIVDTMQRLRRLGWDSLIRDWVAADRPFFGICLGLQALFEHSAEGDTPCLNIFNGRVVRFRPGDGFHFKIPHMGWNQVAFSSAHGLPEGVSPEATSFYFVHSYYVETEDPDLVWGRSQHAGTTFCSAVRSGRLVATQFHPEKSQAAGLSLYRHFVAGLSDAPQ